MIHITPIQDLGILITGPIQDRDIEVWDDELITLTRLPGGRCLVPMRAGTITVRRGRETLASASVDPERKPRLAGSFGLDGAGDVLVWPFFPETDVGILAGEPAQASARGHLDLSRRGLPHRLMQLAVQVHGSAHGPVQLVEYRPATCPSPLRIDYTESHNGPATHLLVDPGDLPGVQVEVTRTVRQTKKSQQGRYEINSRDDRITFDDLLHGDELVVRAPPPFALAGEGGVAVQQRTFRYRAVPEPRLEVLGADQPVEHAGGLRVLSATETLAAVADLVGPEPTWVDEWPVAGSAGGHRLGDSLRTHFDGIEPALTDAAAVAWWVAVVETGQDTAAADRLLRNHVHVRAGSVAKADAALRIIETFPSHVFAELDADGPGAEITAIQDCIGLKAIDGNELMALAGDAQRALDKATTAWLARLRKESVDWLDGAVAPLDTVGTAAELAQRLRSNAQEGLDDLLARRGLIWRVATSTTERPIDVRARQALLHHHVQRCVQALDVASEGFAAIGANMPTEPVETVSALASRLSGALRAAEPAIARLAPVPRAGSAFVSSSIGDVDVLRRHFATWTGDGVPVAVRRQAERLLERWDVAMLERAAVWRAFIEAAPRLQRELAVLVEIPDLEAAARRVAHLLERAEGHLDGDAFAQAQPDLKSLEPAMKKARANWEDAVSRIDETTVAALHLVDLMPWSHVRRRMEKDLEALRQGTHAIGQNDVVMGAEIARIVDGPLRNATERLDRAHGITAARALAAYDEARLQIAERLGGGEALAAMGTGLVEGVRRDLRRRVARMTPLSPAHRAALRACPDIAGATELADILARLDQLQPKDHTAIQDAREVVARIEDAAPWPRVCDRFVRRVIPLLPEITRYMGDTAPPADLMDSPDRVIGWLHAMSRGLKHEATGSDPAVLAPGNRRLLEHTLRDKGVWLG